MPGLGKLIAVFEDARWLLANPDNDFSWSSWEDSGDALEEIDEILASLRSGIRPADLTLGVLFAPTGPLQEVSLSSGWGNDFIELANRFDEAMAQACDCFTTPYSHLAEIRDLGLDSRFAEITLLACSACGQSWLRYFYENEAFSRSGRWYLGAISAEQAASLSVENAKGILENLSWYYYGGSYFDGRIGKAAGSIFLNP